MDKRNRTKYGMSMISNLENIRRFGITHFIGAEKKSGAAQNAVKCYVYTSHNVFIVRAHGDKNVQRVSRQPNQRHPTDGFNNMSQLKNLDLTFADLKREINDLFVSDGWVTVFRSHHSGASGESDAVYCALVKNSAVSDAMRDHRWNLSIGSGRPGFIFSFCGGRQKAVYCRQSDNGYETFIHRRGDFGNEDGYLEISEEFRLYYNLFEHILGPTERRYYHFHDSGDKELVASIEKSSARVQLRYLREYISVRKCHFLLFFEGMRFSAKSPNELGLTMIDENTITPSHAYNHLIRDVSGCPSETIRRRVGFWESAL